MPISQNQFEELAKTLPGMGTDPHSVRQRVEALEKLLERSFVIPGTKIPFGLDSVIGLVPVIGDLITAAMGAYMVWEARNLGMSKWQLMRMSANIGIDTALGAIPLVGDAFDFIWRSNSKNLRIIHKHLDKHHPGTRIIES
ncbi:MAG TPA: DUF4112 domain-containing protein [Sphingorhabdus sp.]|mgnify:FL=1|jgi:hypothetical protein|uniref:DUF4112 domain-containing protein n=1 Tax=Sphingorhabdus sp. TaxID=1902408 RepID=UPI002BCEE436|nr:DUF4112 domain-containing protein [Sphingorhabdus sp.]HMT42444.1 DUF4112 domain-containing protein [Sphingorhabdus sp.]HMU20647.1 DUF4112 domain-containing protein [Sphingorhabdus sp.]